MTKVQEILRADALVDAQFWFEQDQTVTLTIIVMDKDGQQTAVELPYHAWRNVMDAREDFEKKHPEGMQRH
jgi:hypothetical protein